MADPGFSPGSHHGPAATHNSRKGDDCDLLAYFILVTLEYGTTARLRAFLIKKIVINLSRSILRPLGRFCVASSFPIK